MRSRMLALVVGSAVSAFLIGCAQPPNQAINDAKKMLDSAKSIGAEQYALSPWKAAQMSYDLALKQIGEENRKLPFMRKYNKIAETLTSATNAAQSAIAEVETVKSQLRTDTRDLVTRTRAVADSVEAILKIAEKKKKGLESLRNEIDSVRMTIKEAVEALATDNCLLAKEKATRAQERVASVSMDLENLMPAKKVKTSRKRK